MADPVIDTVDRSTVGFRPRLLITGSMRCNSQASYCHGSGRGVTLEGVRERVLGPTFQPIMEDAMAKNTKRKERHQRKRHQRKRDLVRAKSVSPYRKIGKSGELVACYVNDNWQSKGFAAFYVLRHASQHGIVMGAFLVDLWCAGLKDAWGRLDITMEEFNEGVLKSEMADQVDLVRVDLGIVRRIVAGGLRFAQQNGFRLPPRYQRWTALLGDIGDWESADLEDFGVDGKLRWVGPMTDLKARLIACSADDFLSREDVDYVVGDDDFTLVDEDDIAVAEAADELNDRWLSAVRKWCFANSIKPHPRMAEALDIMLESILQAPDAEEIEDTPDAVDMDGVSGNLDRSMGILDPKDADELIAALAQLADFSEQFNSPDEMFAAIGMDELDDGA